MVQLSLPASSQSGGGCRTSQAGDGGGWAGGAGRSGQSAARMLPEQLGVLGESSSQHQ